MKSDIEWKKWGERDPLYAVATWQGKQRGGPDSWTDDDFYELGRLDWADFLKQWEYYGFENGHCVEIGCGAGRITKQLVHCFRQVTALDVSQHQLDYAAARISDPKLTLAVSNGTNLPLGDEVCDAAFSVHVFQHFESYNDAFAVFREIHRVLKVGGSLMIQLPLYGLPDSRVSILLRPIVAVAKWLSDVKAAVDRRQLRKGRWKPVIRRLRFERDQLLKKLQEIGFSQIEFRMFAVKSNHSYHDFVFATKRPTNAGECQRPWPPTPEF